MILYDRLRRNAAFVLALLIAAGATPNAHAQLVIDRAWFELQADTTIELENYRAAADESVEAILNNAFTDATFDFSGLDFSRVYREVNESLPMPADVPGADLEFFSSADYVTIFNYGTGAPYDSISYVFNRIDDDALVQLGWYTIYENGAEPTHARFEPILKPMAIPTAFESGSADMWITESELVTYRGDEVVSTEEIRIAKVVEGYGTLILPTGSYDALRVRNETSTSTPGRTSTGRSISFLTYENTTAHIILNPDATIDRVTYSTRSGVTTSIEPPVAGLPDGYRLDQNYPNPFNPATRIGYEIPRSRHVRISVYDALGRHVETLVDEMMPAGQHEATFEANHLPSGVYLYRMESGAASASRRMILLK